jgi:HrpA-like RNA helicase
VEDAILTEDWEELDKVPETKEKEEEGKEKAEEGGEEDWESLVKEVEEGSGRDQQLKSLWKARVSGEKYLRMLGERKGLPVFQKKADILEIIR